VYSNSLKTDVGNSMDNPVIALFCVIAAECRR
jgi:hypothetical protein